MKLWGCCAVVAPARDEDLGPRAYEVAAIYVDPGRWRSGALRRDADDDPPEVRLRRPLLSEATER